MKITIDSKVIEVPQELLDTMSERGLTDVIKVYSEIDQSIRLGIKTALRTFLLPYIEKKLQITLRPPKEVDPVIYLLSTLTNAVKEISKNASVKIETDLNNGETYNPTSFNITLKDTGEGGRQLAFDWSQG